MSTVEVVTCAGGAAWEGALVRGFQRSELGVRVTRRCVDHGELLGVARRDRPRAALVAAELPWLDRELVAGLGEVGVSVVAMATAPPARPLERLGVVRVLDAASEPDAVAGALRELGVPGASAAPGAPAGDRAGPGSGRLLVVWGGPGAPGRTTVATELAAALAADRPTLLVDADATSATVAQRLGLAESPGLLRAARLAVSAWPDSLPSCAQPVRGGPAVLVGLPRPELWPEVRERAWLDVLDAARDAAGLVVVDVASSIEEDEELAFDHVPYRRNLLGRVALREATGVVLVVAADPVGMRRGLLAHRQLADALPDAAERTVVALNRVPGGARAQQCSVEVERWTGRPPVALLPPEPAFARAVWEGRLLRHVAPRASWLRELRALAAWAVGR